MRCFLFIILFFVTHQLFSSTKVPAVDFKKINITIKKMINYYNLGGNSEFIDNINGDVSNKKYEIERLNELFKKFGEIKLLNSGKTNKPNPYVYFYIGSSNTDKDENHIALTKSIIFSNAKTAFIEFIFTTDYKLLEVRFCFDKTEKNTKLISDLSKNSLHKTVKIK